MTFSKNSSVPNNNGHLSRHDRRASMQIGALSIRSFRAWLKRADLPADIRAQAEVCRVWLSHFSFNRRSLFVADAAADFIKLEAMLGARCADGMSVATET